MEDRPLIIVGSGPAGAATGLRLAQRHPELARDTLILDKAIHPRDKVCAGGLIPHTLACLRDLGVELSVPHVVVDRATVRTPTREVRYEGNDICRVVRRRDFDASLVAAVRARGVGVNEGEKVVDVARDGDGIRVETERTSYRARAVVGADGSGSLVRRRLLDQTSAHTGRAVMCDVPIAAVSWTGFHRHAYDFNFEAVARGLRGYSWAFPCWINGEPHVNVGAYAVDTPGALLTRLTEQELARVGSTVRPRFHAFPIHWYDHRAPLACPRAMLVGDAAGVDPLMGEGISFALEYGRRAADALHAAFASGDFSFAAYQQDVRGSWLGSKLRRLNLAVRLFYGPTWRVWFAIAERSGRARELGLRWYNGIDDWDQRSGWDAVRALWSGEFAPPPAPV
ncbi:MAG TPA: NAD(P)/FAD-dependent oxidoreductase [Candidatus Kryptonia bacterium]|nr:NAD(P)/FAD-dependent oxidoreductase [Candidatus Kryptonia bacterium]